MTPDTPPQGIDRDALLSELSRMLRDDYEGFLSAEEVAAIAEYQTGRILALVRPVGGVVITPEEAEWLRPVLRSMLAPHPAFVIESLADKVSALAARLEAAQ